MTPNIENLKKLRDIVSQIPPDHFHMGNFFTDGKSRYAASFPSEIDEPLDALFENCNTVGCVVGWGAIDLNLNPERLEFTEFSNEILGIDTTSDLWDALFEGDWGAVGHNDEPVVPTDQQKANAIARLTVVIDCLEEDPEWLHTADCKEWIADKLAESETIVDMADERFDFEPDDDY